MTTKSDYQSKDSSFSRIWNSCVREARTVSLFAFALVLLRNGINREWVTDWAQQWTQTAKTSELSWWAMNAVEYFAIAAERLATWLTYLLPSKMSTQQAPGFVLANGWYVSFLHKM